MAVNMAYEPEQSLPEQHGSWADLKAAYRFLNNPRVEPHAISQMHRHLTRRACDQHPVVLCVQDGSELAAAYVPGEEQWMHHTLAVLPDGQLLGMLDQRFFAHVRPPAGETRKQRASRWRESDVWQESVEAIGCPSPGCQFIHVADRASDNLRFMHACERQRSGFVIRAMRDRRVNQATDKLWPFMHKQPVMATIQTHVGRQSGNVNRPAKEGRKATLSLRHAPVRLEEPSNSHEVHDGPLQVHAVYLLEEHPPAGVEPVQWMLLTNLPVKSIDDARQVISHYRKRWVIEEWHRALKEGCRLERSQLTDALALYRLTAILSVVAVRLLQLRDMAADASSCDRVMVHDDRFDRLAVQVVAMWAKVVPGELTVRLFWRTIAIRGGWIGRKSDGRPGWKTIWKGWRKLQAFTQTMEEYQATYNPPPN